MAIVSAIANGLVGAAFTLVAFMFCGFAYGMSEQPKHEAPLGVHFVAALLWGAAIYFFAKSGGY